ncbi:unnamed protein product, partial [Durusdinium trenchii]
AMDRAKFLLQLRLVHRCGQLLQERIKAGARYDWLLRLRADAYWHRFPGFGTGGQRILLPWAPILQWQAFADNFAAGTPSLMLKYFDFYNYVLDARNWKSYDFPKGDKVWRRHWAHECNYPELILERYLVDQHLPVRYTRDICFVRLRRCKEQSFEDHCKVRPGGAGGAGAWDDLEPWRRWHLQGMEVLPEQTFPAQYEHDPVLAAKLVDFFHAEQRKVGRPLKIVDLGCGRGTLEFEVFHFHLSEAEVAELRAWRLLAVGLDTNPLLTATLNAYGLVADVTEANLSFTLRSAHPRCNFRPHLGKFAKGGEYEDAGQSAGVQFDGRPNKQDMSNPTGWINWINYVAARCCGQLTCRAFDTLGRLRWQLPERQTWRSSQEVWLYEKYQDLPDVAEAQVASPFEHGPGILLPVQSGATMDWAICLDVGEQLNGRRQQARLLANLGRLAGEGILISWGRRAPRDDSWWLRDLALLGFQRDKDLEGELRLFAGREFGSRCDLRWERIALQEHLRHSLCVLRRGTPRPRHPRCALEPVKATPYCELGITFGCLDAQHIWLRGHCAGLFRRFAPRSSNRSTAAVGECRLVTTSLHEYEECKLPEPVEPSSPGHLAVETSRGTESPAHRPSYDCVSLGVPLEDFWRLHGISLNALFDSADPLVRMAEPIWTQESCGVLAMSFKLLRLLAAPQQHFFSQLQKVWSSEGQFILQKWRWELSDNCWLSSLLLRAARRWRATAPRPGGGLTRSRVRLAARRLRRCALRRGGSCKAAVSALRPPLRHAASERASFGELLQECGCKCGESIATLGAFFIAAAGAFWLVGALAGWNGPDTHFQSDLTYHQFNMFWFYLGGITVAVGIVYALYARKGSAFAREPADQPEDEEGKEKPAAAPTPYVMLPAEP